MVQKLKICKAAFYEPLRLRFSCSCWLKIQLSFASSARLSAEQSSEQPAAAATTAAAERKAFTAKRCPSYFGQLSLERPKLSHPRIFFIVLVSMLFWERLDEFVKHQPGLSCDKRQKGRCSELWSAAFPKPVGIASVHSERKFRWWDCAG